MNSQPPRRKSPVGAVGAILLAFVPSLLILLLLVTNQAVSHPHALVVLIFAISVGCCIASSIMLFERGTIWTILFGILLTLLNFAIIAGLGCAACITQ